MHVPVCGFGRHSQGCDARHGEVEGRMFCGNEAKGWVWKGVQKVVLESRWFHFTFSWSNMDVDMVPGIAEHASQVPDWGHCVWLNIVAVIYSLTNDVQFFFPSWHRGLQLP